MTHEERKATEEKAQEAFLTLMAEVPKYLTGWTWTNIGWGNKPTKDHGHLIGSDEKRISVKLDAWHNRITLSSVYPNHYPVQAGESISITVSPSKTPQQIAKDLERRLLPKYIKELQAQKDRIRRQTEYEANRKNTLDRIAKHFELEHDRNLQMIYPYWKCVHMVENYGEDTVKFTVECDADKAIEVLELLKD